MATKRAKINKTLEKAKKLVSKKNKKTPAKRSYPDGQNAPQSKVYTMENDKLQSAKNAGWRFTKEGAKKLGKSPSDRPTTNEIEKYRNETFKVKGKSNKSGPRGTGDGSYRYIYIERRADKSDLNKTRKLELGGENPDEMLLIKRVFVDVYEDTYDQGEGKHVNTYEFSHLKGARIKAKDFVMWAHINAYTSNNPQDYQIIDGRITTSQLQDADGNQFDKNDIEAWKDGDKLAYSAHIDFIVEAVKERTILDDSELSKATGIIFYAKGGEMANGGEDDMMKVIKSIRKTKTNPDDVSPNFVNEVANKIGVNLTSQQVVEISDNYGSKYADGGEMAKGGEMFIDIESGDFRSGIFFDPTQVREFEKYVFSWYGKNGVAVDDMEENIPATTAEVLKAVSQYLTFCNKNSKDWGGGDSFDREVVHDIISYNRNPNTTTLFYESLINKMKKTPILEYGGILQPMIGGVNADPRFDIYNVPMFAEKGAEVPDGEKMERGGIFEVGKYYKKKDGSFYRYLGNGRFMGQNGMYKELSHDDFFAKGGKLGDKFEEAYDFGERMGYVRDFGKVELEVKGKEKEVNLVVLAKIINLYEATGDDKFKDTPYEVTFEIVPELKQIDKKHIEDALQGEKLTNDTANYGAIFEGYMSGVPLSVLGNSYQLFKTYKQAENYILTKNMNDEITSLSRLVGFVLDRPVNRIGTTGWSLLTNILDKSHNPYRFSKGGKIGEMRERVIDYYLKDDIFDDPETYGVSEEDLKKYDFSKLEKAIIKYHGLNDPSNVEERFEALGLGDDYAKGGETKIYEVATRTKGKSGEFASSVRAKSKEDALRIYKEKHGDDKNKVIVDVYETTRKRLEDGGEMAKGGSTHEQGYDDREDERLAMRRGKIASKDFVGSHKRREHSRRDDARFETRK